MLIKFVNAGIFSAVLLCNTPHSSAKNTVYQEGFLETYVPKKIGSMAKSAVNATFPNHPEITMISGKIGKEIFGTETLTEGIIKTGLKYFLKDPEKKQQETPEHILEGQKNFTAVPSANDSNVSSPFPLKANHHYRALSLDGGGIRGIGTLQMLKNLEERTCKSVQEVYDVFVGTSTGGIIATCFAKGITATKLMEMYYNEGDKIFDTSWWHKATNLMGFSGPRYEAEKITELADKFLGKADVSTVIKPFAVTTRLTTDIASKGGKQSSKFKLLKSHKNVNLINPKHADKKLSMFIRATSAAPTYFEGIDFDGSIAVDGGVAANDPCLQAYTYTQQLFGKSANICLDSFGTGDVSKEVRNANALPHKAGKLSAVTKLPELFMGGASCAAQHTMKKLLGDKYKRFQFTTGEEIDLADVSKKDALIEYGNIASHTPEFNELVAELKSLPPSVLPEPVVVPILPEPVVVPIAPELIAVKGATKPPTIKSTPKKVSAKTVQRVTRKSTSKKVSAKTVQRVTRKRVPRVTARNAPRVTRKSSPRVMVRVKTKK